MPAINEVALVAVLIVLSFAIDIWVLRTFLVLCPPNEVLVVMGGRSGHRLVFGGRVLRKPILERDRSLARGDGCHPGAGLLAGPAAGSAPVAAGGVPE